MGLERTTLTRNLAPLEAKKWISTRPGEDPRARMIVITAQGRGIVRRGFPFWSEAQAHVGRLLGAEGEAALKILSARSLA